MLLLQIWAITPDGLQMGCEGGCFELCLVDGGERCGELLGGCGVEIRDVPDGIGGSEKLTQDVCPLMALGLP